MPVRPEQAVVGATFYSRRRHKMGNTTMSTLGEWPVRVVEAWDPAKGYAVCSWNGSSHLTRYYPADLKRLFDWSMDNANEAEVVRGVWDRAVKVTRRKKCPKCRARHASPECPDTVGDAIRSIMREEP